MNQLCLNSTPCPGDLPLANFSSDVPDKVDYVTLTGPPPGVDPPIGGNVWKSRYCLGVCNSDVSQADADACAAKASLECLVTVDPNPSGGGGGGGGGWSRPDYPSGAPTAPGSQPPAGGPSIPLFQSEPEECTDYCPDGTPSTAKVAAGSYVGYTQKAADGRAHQAACAQAKAKKICFGTIEKYACLTGNYSSLLSVTGQLSPYSFKVTLGELPPGITMVAETVLSTRLSGKVLGAGKFEFEITATDVEGNTAAKAFEIDVLGLANDSDTDFPDAQVGEAYGWQFEADGGVEPYTFILGGGYSNINGIALDPDGFFHGTPNTPGIKDFTVIVTDATGRSCQEDLQIDIMAAQMDEFGCAAVPTTILFGGYVGQVKPLTFTPVDGTVPQGMDLVVLSDHEAALDGTPFPAGTYDFTIRVTDSLNNKVDQPVRFYVLGIINGEDWQVTGGVVNKPYSYQLESLGGQEPNPTFTYSKISGSLPNGLTLHASGLIDGTPTTEQTTKAIIRTTDQNGHACQEEITFIVYPTPPVDFRNIVWGGSTIDKVGVCDPLDLYAIGTKGPGFATLEVSACPVPQLSHSILLISGTLTYAGPANTPCRLSVDAVASSGACQFGLASAELRNHAGGIMKSFSGSGHFTFDFLWGDTGGGITLNLRTDAYTSNGICPVNPGGFASLAATLSPTS